MKPSRSALAASVVALAAGLLSQPLHAQSVSQAQSTGPSDGSLIDHLLGRDAAAKPQAEADNGASEVALSYTFDWLRNTRGGLKRGTMGQGVFNLQWTLDLEKQFGWPGTTLFVSAFDTHNSGRIRRDHVGGLNTIAAIEAKSATRLSEL